MNQPPLGEMSLDQLMSMQTELKAALKVSALNELAAAEARVNELRAICGMKQRPVSKISTEAAPAQKTTRKKRTPAAE